MISLFGLRLRGKGGLYVRPVMGNGAVGSRDREVILPQVGGLV